MMNMSNKDRSEGGMPDHLQVARDLRDKLDEVILSGTGKSSEIREVIELALQQLGVGRNAHASRDRKMRKVEIIEDNAVCGHSCSKHEELMSPVLWGTLPKDLLQLVLARLPLCEIIRLQCLSKEWNTTTKTAGSVFLQGCEHRVFGLVSERQDPESGGMWVRVFDTKANRWHAFDILAGVLGGNDRLHGMAAGDGGLICFVSSSVKKEANPLRVVVVNPLTREHKVLPQLSHLSSVQPEMVQLTMERPTNCYKVIVVGLYKASTLGSQAEIYDSVTQHWIIVDQSSDHLVFGSHFSWEPDDNEEYWEVEGDGECAYDCRGRQLCDFCGQSPVMPFPVVGHEDLAYTMLKNHLFVLKEEGRQLRTHGNYHPWHPGSTHCITEFSAQSVAAEWVKVKTYECKPLERPPQANSPGYLMDIHVTQDFLLVVATYMEDPPYRQQLVWLYDFSTGTWRDIPGIPNNERYGHNHYMCELQWNVAP